MSKINLKEFIDGYKTVEIEYPTDNTKKWVFREPLISDLDLPIVDLLKKNLIEGSWEALERMTIKELTKTQRDELLTKILTELGLAL